MREEDEIQSRLVKHLRYRSVPGALTQYIHSNSRSAAEMGYLKAMGLLKGFPDLLHIFNGQVVFHEIKTEKGKLSPEQKDMHSKILKAGVAVYTSNGFDKAIADCIAIGLIRG